MLIGCPSPPAATHLIDTPDCRRCAAGQQECPVALHQIGTAHLRVGSSSGKMLPLPNCMPDYGCADCILAANLAADNISAGLHKAGSDPECEQTESLHGMRPSSRVQMLDILFRYIRLCLD